MGLCIPRLSKMIGPSLKIISLRKIIFLNQTLLHYKALWILGKLQLTYQEIRSIHEVYLEYTVVDSLIYKGNFIYFDTGGVKN